MTTDNKGVRHDEPPPNWVRVSLTADQVRVFKRVATCGAPYAERVSVGLAYRLWDMRQNCGEDQFVLREIDVLEGIRSHSATKPERQFKSPPLYPFWHKHFFTPRHLMSNICIRWGVDKDGNRDLTEMLEAVARDCGDRPGVWQNKAAYDFIVGGLQDRSSVFRMTGDWIIYGKYAGQNYYLDLASHQEGKDDPHCLVAKLCGSSVWDFPYLFSSST